MTYVKRQRCIYKKNKHRFSEYIQEDFIDLCLQKMNVEKKLGVNLELLAISQIFKINIKVYFLLTMMDPYIEIETQSTEKKLFIFTKRAKNALVFLLKKNQRLSIVNIMK